MSGDFPEEWFRPPSATPESPANAQPPAPSEPVNAAAVKQVGVQVFEPASAPPTAPARRHSPWRLLAALVVVVVIIAAATWVVHQMWMPTTATSRAPAATVPVSPSAAPSQLPATPVAEATPWLGAVNAVVPEQVSATCTAPAQTGQGGERVPSDATRLLDDDATTGWRCNGDAVGERITFTFPPGTKLVGVRVVNGYSKITNGHDLYPQYRRATTIRWSLPGQGDAFFVQELDDESSAPQEVRIPRSDARGGVTAQIVSTAPPGSTDETRDALVLTSVTFLGRA